MAGKPFSPIYDLCFAELADVFGIEVNRRRVLAIGDGLSTDALGARQQGLDLLYITSGIHSRETAGESGRLDLNRVKQRFDTNGSEAIYLAEKVHWA